MARAPDVSNLAEPWSARPCDTLCAVAAATFVAAVAAGCGGCGLQCRSLESDYETARASRLADAESDRRADVAVVFADDLVEDLAVRPVARRVRKAVDDSMSVDVESERPVAVELAVDSIDTDVTLGGGERAPTLRMEVTAEVRATIDVPELPKRRAPAVVEWNDEIPLAAERLDDDGEHALVARVADEGGASPSAVDVELEEMRESWRHVLSAEIGATIAERLARPAPNLELARRSVPELAAPTELGAPSIRADDELTRIALVVPTSIPVDSEFENSQLLDAPSFGDQSSVATVTPRALPATLVRRNLREGDLPGRFGPKGEARSDGPNRVVVDNVDFSTPADVDRPRLETEIEAWHLPDSRDECHFLRGHRTAVVAPGKRLSLDWRAVQLFEPYRDKPDLELSAWDDSPLYDGIARLTLAGLRLDTVTFPEVDVSTRNMNVQVGERLVSTAAEVRLDTSPDEKARDDERQKEEE